MGAYKKIHDKDRMTAEERLDTVIRVAQPDRVPLSMMLYNYGPFHTGVKAGDYVSKPEVYMETMHRVYKDIGPWDIYYNINPVSSLVYGAAMMMRQLLPGKDLPDDVMTQIEEFEYMTTEDYDEILKLNFNWANQKFRTRMLTRFCKDVEGAGYVTVLGKLIVDSIKQALFWMKDWRWWREQGLAIQMGYQAEMPVDTFSQARAVVPFSMDILQRPDKIRMAALRLAPNFAENSIWIAKFFGVPRIQCYLHRTSNSFMSPKQFEHIAFPSMELIVCRFIDAGMTPILHCDGDWLRNLEILRRLPAKKCIIQLDGLTDIFKAKKEIGDHMCIFGDVPAEMLVNGSPQEVDEYCHRLIEEVGKNGGFILGAGCEIPYNATAENLRAMTESVVKHGYY